MHVQELLGFGKLAIDPPRRGPGEPDRPACPHPRPYRNFKLTNATIASVIATR